MDEYGHIIYITGSSTFDRIAKLYIDKTNTFDIDDSHAFWTGIDGNFYSDLGKYNRSIGLYLDNNLSNRNYAKYIIKNNNFEKTLINVSDNNYTCFNSYRSHIMKTKNKVISYEYRWSGNAPIKICELYNSTMIPKNFSIDLKGILDAKGSNDYYYILGVEKSLPESFSPFQPSYIPGYTTMHPYISLRKYNPSDHTFTKLIEEGQYAIFTFNVTLDDIVTFSGKRLSDGLNVTGVIKNNELKIIDEQSNISIFMIENI